ncbi:cupin domain-containing protein [Candidatus Gracilibacteria bacterium]|jgi:nitric oxide dioxygenase|nr:cupin domain-containing protein [Candidatus Gracilibacteria bacterium]NJM89469.1 cupin domain-containing protein [Hydrococcus sp. RU_2_2]NJP20905.1 cupin domain-containing protein [Hydrococcus sp. CRU_1_1]
MNTTTSNSSFSTLLQDEIEYPKAGILSKVLVKDKNCQYTLFCLAKDTGLEEHTATRNAVITVIEGKGTLVLEGNAIALQPSTFVFMKANAPHALKAEENLAFVLALSESSQPN